LIALSSALARAALAQEEAEPVAAGGEAPAGPGAAAMEQADRPEDAVPLEPGKTLKGHLAAGAAGHFAYYSFEHGGDDAAYTIDLRVTPDDYAVLQSVGFNAYGPDPQQVYGTAGIQHRHRPNMSGNVFSSDGGPFLVQVFNRHPNVAIDFEITGTQQLPSPDDPNADEGPPGEGGPE
jgi:hypothetical protein